jgi:hypothetical protein
MGQSRAFDRRGAWRDVDLSTLGGSPQRQDRTKQQVVRDNF